MFEEHKSDDPSPVEMIIDVDPTPLLEQPSDASDEYDSQKENTSLDISTDSESEFHSRLGNINWNIKETFQLEDQNETFEETLRSADCEKGGSSAIKILLREPNPFDSESVYSEIDCEEEETITPTTFNETTNKQLDSSTVPEMPDLSYLPSNSRSTSIESPDTTNLTRKIYEGTARSPL